MSITKQENQVKKESSIYSYYNINTSVVIQKNGVIRIKPLTRKK